jgi:triosephosphate isomerase
VVAEALGGSGIWVAAQDVSEHESGAFTGDVSAPMLRDVGVTRVIVGHSERRRGLGESPARIGAKLASAVAHGLAPILCVGETLEERESGRMDEVLLEQLAAGLEGQTEASVADLIIAYEPVWAIGTGVNATPDQAGAAHRVIREWLGGRFSSPFADAVRIQYGGSVKPGNAAELMAVDGVDGSLVGGASLDVASFVGILEASRG